MLTHKQDGEFQNYWCPIDSIRSLQCPAEVNQFHYLLSQSKEPGNLAMTDI